MIISKTPFRISFAGGGTDIADYYKTGKGCVVSTAINKYMFISVHQPFDNRIRLKYSKTELVDKVEQIEHPIIRECLKLTGLDGGIEITSVSECDLKITISDMSGRSVATLMEEKGIYGNKKYSLKLSDIPKGNFILTASVGKDIFIRKFVIE